MSFALKRLLGSARMFCSGLSRGVFPFFQVLFGLPFHFLTITPRRRFQFHTRPSRLRQANRDCLFCVTRRACPHGCDPFPPAQTLLLGCWGLSLREHLLVRVLSFVSLA